MLYAMCCTMMYYDMLSLYYVMLYHDVLYYTITIPWYTMIYHDVLWYDMMYYHYTMIWCTITPWYAITILWCATTMSHASHQDRSTSFTHTSSAHTPATNTGRGMPVPESPVRPGKRLSFPAALCKGPEQCQVHWPALTAWERVRHYVLYDGIVWWYSVM